MRILAIAALLMAFLASSCNRQVEVGVKEMHWKEEVRLHDGRMIIVDRSAAARSSGFPNARYGATIRQELSYEPGKLVFTVVNTSEEPIALDEFNGQFYLVTLRHGAARFCRDKRDGAYIAGFYRFDGKQFVKIDQASAPVDLMIRNLTGRFRKYIASEGPIFISWNDHRALDRIDPNKPMTVAQFFAKHETLRCP